MTTAVHTLLEDDARLRAALRKADDNNRDRRPDPCQELSALQRGAACTEVLARIETAAQAAAAWREVQPQQGWVLHQSGQAAFDATRPLPDTNAWGALLAAEAVDAEGRSLRLARNAEGRWVLTRTTHDPQGDGVYDEVQHLASAREFGALHYRRYWVIDAQGLLALHSAHFFGYVTPE